MKGFGDTSKDAAQLAAAPPEASPGDHALHGRARFQGSEMKIKLEDASDPGNSMFQVLVDGKDMGLLRPKPGSKVVTAVTGQPSTTHDVEVCHSM